MISANKWSRAVSVQSIFVTAGGELNNIQKPEDQQKEKNHNQIRRAARWEHVALTEQRMCVNRAETEQARNPEREVQRLCMLPNGLRDHHQRNMQNKDAYKGLILRREIEDDRTKVWCR